MQKGIFVKDMAAPNEAEGVFVITLAAQGSSRNGPYWRLVLADASGSVEAKIWSPLSASFPALHTGSFFYAHGRVSTFRDQLQFTVEEGRLLSPEEGAALDLADFMPASPYPLDAMMDELMGLIREEFRYKPWRKLVDGVFKNEELREAFRTCPAAKGVHHAYAGGLLEHTLSVFKLCRCLADQYPELDRQTLLAGAIILIFSFLLSVVGISSIAFTGNEPVSGMTIFMIIVSAVFMGNAGMSGSSGIIAILLMAAFLCSTLAVAGNFMSELKVAYLTGATPKKMQQWQILSIIVSSFIAVGVIFLLDHAYGYTGSGALAAPQANAMAAIVKPMMDGGAAPWPLYMAGAFFAFLLWMMKVPPLAFALGAYLPMEINTPVLIGGLVSYFVSHSSKDDALNALRLSEGSTVASGFVAGGAIGSLISAVLHIGGIDWFLKDWVVTPGATYLGIVAYLVMCAVIYTVACKIKKV